MSFSLVIPLLYGLHTTPSPFLSRGQDVCLLAFLSLASWRTNIKNGCLDQDEDEIKIDGTLKWCEHLGVNPEDVVLLAIAYELKSMSMGTWTRAGWVDGWRSLG